MRLRSVWISQYKNLRDFSLNFHGDGFIDIFVGKNGSGKSNFLEALIEIFDHILAARTQSSGPVFDYRLDYEVGDRNVELGWQGGELTVDGQASRRTIGRTPAPDHVLVYYSGQNTQVAALVRRYEEQFRDALRRADAAIAPKIIGIGPSCKKLLVVTMLMLPEQSVARQLLCHKLRILNCRRSVELVIRKPFFVTRPNHDPFDESQLFWGVTGYARTFLLQLVASIEGEFTPGQLYDREIGRYRLTCNIDQLRAASGDEGGLTLFRSLEALRVLDMLDDVKLPLALDGLEVSGLDLFSDGQFQSVYLFGIAELFKDLNCVALLDEPDAFLHPEWQFEFLRQVESISAEAARTNHFLLTSHSASTIAARAPARIRMFELGEAGVTAVERDKTTVIGSLSAGLISFSESEATLSVDNVLTNTTGPVLFVEGVSDVAIMETAWHKLYAEKPCPFAIVQAFDSAFLRNLLKRQTLYDSHPGRTFFALFDFDGAYSDWVQLGSAIESDVGRCLTRQRADGRSFAMLLPVHGDHPLRPQVVRPDGNDFGPLSRFTIELLFYGIVGLEGQFSADLTEPSQPTRFAGEKVRFAQDVVPGLDAQHFERFRPIFDFLMSKI